MTYIQAVFSIHAIFCFFYGSSTFFNPDITVAMGLARKNKKMHRRVHTTNIRKHRCIDLNNELHLAIFPTVFTYNSAALSCFG